LSNEGLFTDWGFYPSNDVYRGALVNQIGVWIMKIFDEDWFPIVLVVAFFLNLIWGVS
jgi:hypothetical protein